jgi:hypothetical protein
MGYIFFEIFLTQKCYYKFSAMRTDCASVRVKYLSSWSFASELLIINLILHYANLDAFYE